jgi:hypothetical protein
MARWLIITGLLIAAIGFAWPWIQRLGLGRLPGDIVVDREGVRIYIPITTSILISIVISLIAWLGRRFG